MRLEATRESKPFAERIAIFTKYIEPFKQMWPFYWLKVAAIRDPQTTTWRLRYFSLVGRWNESKPIQEVFHTTDSAILAISQQIDAETAWRLLASLQTSGTLTLESLPNAIIEATPEPDVTLPSASYWQDSLSYPQSRAITEVAEPAKWLYLYISDTNRKEIGKPLSGEEKHMMEARVRAAVQDDVDLLGLNDFAHFCATYLGLGYNGRQGAECTIDDFFYQFDLPLAFRIEREASDRAANTLPLVMYCQPPLTLEGIEVRPGERPLPNTNALPVAIEIAPEQGWSVGKVIVPYTCGNVWFKFSALDKPLAYEIPLPTREDQLTDVLGSLYQTSSPDQGVAKWRRHLLESDPNGNGTNFEIALLNALTRLGMPVFFAGQVRQEAGAGGSGTSTAGYDLIVLDQARRHVILISAKGSPQVPKDEVCQKLLDAMAGIQQLLPGWSVRGVIACHTPNNKLVRLKSQTSFKVWGHEDLEKISQADSRETIASLL